MSGINDGPPLKELRSSRREGSNLIEEYECLNPDGTVTKTVTITDQNDGHKQVDVFKMDRSGIVRKIDSRRSQGEVVPESARRQERLQNQTTESQSRYQEEFLEDVSPQFSKPQSYNQYFPDGDRNLGKSDDEFLQLHRDAKMLSPEMRMLIFSNYREKLLEYGKKKLERKLREKLNDNNNASTIAMTQDQKDNLVNYGKNKMQNLLMNNLNEEMFFSEILPRYERESNSTSSNNLQRGEDSMKSKPISFNIRPEDGMKNSKEELIKFALQGMKNTITETQKMKEKQSESSYERRLQDPLLKAIKEEFSNKFQKPTEPTQQQNTHLHQYLDQPTIVEPKKHKEPEEKFREHASTDYPIDILDVITYLAGKLKSKPRDEMTNRKYDKLLNKVFDENEIFEFGLKTLRKLLKKTHEVEFKQAQIEPRVKQPRGCSSHLNKQQAKGITADESDSPGKWYSTEADQGRSASKDDEMEKQLKTIMTNRNEHNAEPKSGTKEISESYKNTTFLQSFESLLDNLKKALSESGNKDSPRVERSNNSRIGQNESQQKDMYRTIESEPVQEKRINHPTNMDNLLQRVQKAMSGASDYKPTPNNQNNSINMSQLNHTQPQTSQYNTSNDGYGGAFRVNPMTFKIHPQGVTPPERPNEKRQSAIDKSDFGNFPWWFNQSSDFMDDSPVKNPITSMFKSPLLNTSMFGDVFNTPLLGDS